LRCYVNSVSGNKDIVLFKYLLLPYTGQVLHIHSYLILIVQFYAQSTCVVNVKAGFQIQTICFQRLCFTHFWKLPKQVLKNVYRMTKYFMKFLDIFSTFVWLRKSDYTDRLNLRTFEQCTVIFKSLFGPVWWSMPVISALERLRGRKIVSSISA
jgi:hypothetical protein